MSSFNLKDLFVKPDENENKSEVPKVPSTTFSTQGTTNNNFQIPNTNDPLLQKVIESYQKGFDSLNLPNPDFWEFYQAINENPNPDGAIYKATFSGFKMMGITKAKLLEYAQYYITEIGKQHSAFDNQGKEKIQSLQLQKGTEETALKSEVETLQAQLLQLQQTLATKQQALQGIEAKYAEESVKTQQTIVANDHAKDTLLGKINAVVTGIQNNIPD